jgi:hypothetical protein
MAQPLKKKEIKKFDVSAFKKKISSAPVADKPMEWIIMPKAFQDALHIPGIPAGYMSGVRGWSDTGKSTIKNCLIAAAQKQGILPIIFETEGNFDFKYAIDCGMEAEPVMGVNEETGEETVVDYDGSFILFNNAAICDYCGDMDYSTGTKKSTKRTVAVIEDIAYIINDLIDKQEAGEIPMPLLFVWDSVGSIGSWKSYTSKAGNNMFDAGALSVAFNNIINARIPGSRSQNSPYTNTFFVVNKIWLDSMNSVGGAASIENKGGKSFFYAMRLLLHVGGVAKAGTKRLKATYKGNEYQYGVVSKISIAKNQLPTPFNVTYAGTICCVHNGLCGEKELDAYKKEYIPEIMSRMAEALGKEEIKTVDTDSVSFEEEDNFDE